MAALERAGLLDARLALGLSGGLDSIVLLDLLAQVRRRHGIRLTAIHVNHRISQNASNWAQFCTARCAAYQVPCNVVEVEVRRDGGAGLEAAARDARYAVFQQQDVDAVVLAHHLDDQTETLLLQLLRGAGPRGLAGMPQARWLASDSRIRLLRPLLEVPREPIADYARRHRLEWVEDESNASLGFDRNWLRHEVLPRIATRFPAYRQTWLRASRNFAELSDLADALAQIDATTAVEGEGLRIAALRGIGEVRGRNLLRWFLVQHGLRLPGRERIDEALRQLLAPRAGAQPLIELGAGCLRRHRGVVHVVQLAASVSHDWQAAWRGQPSVPLPDTLGCLYFDPALGAGLSAERLASAPVSVRLRTGGERLKLAPNRPARTLKNLLREAGVPTWQRERLPLLFCGEAPIWAPAIGYDTRFAAAPEEPGMLVRWSRSVIEKRDRKA